MNTDSGVTQEAPHRFTLWLESPGVFRFSKNVTNKRLRQGFASPAFQQFLDTQDIAQFELQAKEFMPDFNPALVLRTAKAIPFADFSRALGLTKNEAPVGHFIFAFFLGMVERLEEIYRQTKSEWEFKSTGVEQESVTGLLRWLFERKNSV